MTPLRSSWLLILVAALLWAAPASSQGDGSLNGRVIDESGLSDRLNFLKGMLRAVHEAEVDGAEIRLNNGRLPTTGMDFARLDRHQEGVFTLEFAAATKLRTSEALQFGSVKLETGNITPDYPGLYSLWLSRDQSGDWTLLFNEDIDVWGTMYDPSKTVGEVAIEYEMADNALPGLLVRVEQDDSEGAELVFLWGKHRWRAPFQVAN